MKRRILCIVALTLTTLACASSTKRMAEISERDGDWDQAVLYYLDLVQDQPDNIAYRAALMRARIRASQMHFQRGQEYKEAGADFDRPGRRRGCRRSASDRSPTSAEPVPAEPSRAPPSQPVPVRIGAS